MSLQLEASSSGRRVVRLAGTINQPHQLILGFGWGVLSLPSKLGAGPRRDKANLNSIGVRSMQRSPTNHAERIEGFMFQSRNSESNYIILLVSNDRGWTLETTDWRFHALIVGVGVVDSRSSCQSSRSASEYRDSIQIYQASNLGCGRTKEKIPLDGSSR